MNQDEEYQKFKENWLRAVDQAVRYHRTFVFLYSRFTNKRKSTAKKLKDINIYLDSFQSEAFILDIYNRAERKFEKKDLRIKTFNVWIDIPLEYSTSNYPKCINLRIKRDFSVDLKIREIASNRRDLVFK